MPIREEFCQHIDEDYTATGDFITMGAAMMHGKAVTDVLVKIPLKTLNAMG